jgi:hypothetical protein
MWTMAAAIGGLILGIVNFTWSVIRPWWESRPAHLAARSELYSPSWRPAQPENRVVIQNAGPAQARNLTVRVYADGDVDITDQIDSLWPPMPFPALHAGHSLHLKCSGSRGTPTPRRVSLIWRDNRPNVHQEERWLSFQEY